ncbi:hypothetical protein HY214_01740 [Candidatus Roizmanbacteria bacterium]|nr:hypothetical protein [Candidatus Roizmanbacteria bacterium]
MNGYEVVRGDFDERNPLEIGLGTDLPNIGSERERNEKIAERAGLPMPERYALEKITGLGGPVMAKFDRSHGGDHKYLLETTEQKIRFIAAFVHYPAILSHMTLTERGDLLETGKALTFLLQTAGMLIQDGSIFTRQSEGLDILKNEVVFQEFIRTPSQRYTTYRVLADAFGNVHYSALVCSQGRKAEARLVQPVRTSPLSLDEQSEILRDQASLLDHLFTHPKNPFFLNSRSAKSYNGDSDDIILSGQKIESEEYRAILEAHGINPDQALPSAELLSAGSRLGRSFRFRQPYGGFDIIQSEDGKLFFLEANDDPALIAEGLGMAEDSTRDEMRYAIVSRMLQSVKTEPQS